MGRIALCNDPGSYVNDSEGTLVSVNGSSGVSFEGKTIALVGDKVKAHFNKQNQHGELVATLVTGSPDITINGIPVVREGDLASCGHTVIINSTIGGSSDYEVSGN